ncbi:S8 family peptidase [uncultured Flavobacterium sp.]|uniref:S8 family peptidase n=1 Tax=uncultured Flavobacterium sp. TaxID=165435 RepID=UPI00292F9F90|nr:S8 family peptidase [uncultured Flavobacterium sp.]
MKNKIVFLKNEKSQNIGFDRQRNVGGNKKNDVNIVDEEELPKYIKEFQKSRLRVNKVNFYGRRKKRNLNRTVEMPIYLDLIKIQFFKIFDSKLNKDFAIKYGLSPIEYLDFNKTVIFQIDNREAFKVFTNHIDLVIDSPKNTNYKNADYNLIALIFRFEFFDSRNRILTYNGNGILISLISTYLGKLYKAQKSTLLEVLGSKEVEFSYSDSCPDIIEIRNANRALIQIIADNFDIVRSITSSRTEKIRPGIAGPVREYGFDVEVPDDICTVGIIDTGISKIKPLKDLILSDYYNHTPYPAFWDEEGHGTLVSGLVAFGEDFYKNDENVYEAKAKLFNIKALHFSNDDLNIPQLIEDIRNAKRDYGIKIFNMSLVIPSAKKYNSSYSQFAYELDRLAHQEDLIIFLAVGNFDSDNLKSLKEESDHPDHEYPYFFYSLLTDSDSHNCEDTNICVPSESLNNISVGALAGNFSDVDLSDITPVNFYPAYYTRKFHFDYSQPVNGTEIKQKNNYLNKPDFVMEGGDLFNYNSGIQILRSPIFDSEKFYGKTCGTSLATPLLASYAAEILNLYPNIKAQSIKALLINSSSYYERTKLEHFKDHSAQLLKSLVGFGRPKKEHLLFTNDNSVQYLIEDSIKVNQIIKIPIFLPKYLLTNQNKLNFDIALSFSFLPVKDNHLDYLPLHISFNIVKNIEIKDIAKKQDSYGIKNVFSWSEDHFGIDNKLFSNSHSKSYRFQPNDIINCDGSVALAVRCLAKNEYIEGLSKHPHEFSITVKVTEILSNQNSAGINLYSEMMKINNYLEIEADTDLDALV